MIRVINYRVRENADGEEFCALILSGGIEMVKSQNTGRHYATMRKCSIPSTFDEETCKSLIGSEIPGSIEKQKCEPYEFETKSGEVITLDFTYVYVEPTSNVEEQIFHEVV